VTGLLLPVDVSGTKAQLSNRIASVLFSDPAKVQELRTEVANKEGIFLVLGDNKQVTVLYVCTFNLPTYGNYFLFVYTRFLRAIHCTICTKKQSTPLSVINLGSRFVYFYSLTILFIL
jgi:hypothetical protein